MDQIKIGKFIARLRKEHNMTQLDLATRLGVTDRAVSKWENGRGLPDLSLIKPLCEALSISINELLNGERIKEEETLKIANQNMIVVLSDREREIKKRHCLAAMAVILAVITAVFGIVFSIVLGGLLTAELRGDGYSFSSAYYTIKARRVVKYITNSEYEKAAQLIGFYTDDRAAAEKEWCQAMEELSDTIHIEQFTTYDMYEDDHGIFGYTTMIVYDYQSKKRFVYKIQTIAQNGGIAFDSATMGLYGFERDKQVGELIDGVLETWDAG